MNNEKKEAETGAETGARKEAVRGTGKEALAWWRKAILFAGGAVVCAVVYGVVLYLLEVFFGAEEGHSFKMIAVQSILFGIFFTWWSVWLAKRRKKRENGNKN